MTDRDLPALGEHAIPGQLGEALVQVAALELGQLYHPRAGLDFGIDGVIELTTEGLAKQATGREIGVQVKRGLSAVRRTRRGWTLYFTAQHANYWLTHTLPIIIVHSDPTTRRLRWRHVNAESVRKTLNGHAIDLPEDSDLAGAIDQLRAIASGRAASAAPQNRNLILTYSCTQGILATDPELGLRALSFSRGAIAGEPGIIVIEVDDHPDLIASIDGIRDVTAPSVEEQREVIRREDILRRSMQEAKKLERALNFLLTEPAIAETFGYRDEWIAEAVRRTASGSEVNSRQRGKLLRAWPSHRVEHPMVSFEVSSEAMEHFYAQNDMNRTLIRRGGMGNQSVGDLPVESVATRFLPQLVKSLTDFADPSQISDDEVMKRIGVPPTMWLMAMA